MYDYSLVLANSCVVVLTLQNAISVFIRLGFAHKKSPADASRPDYHTSWTNNGPTSPLSSSHPHLSPLTLTDEMADLTSSADDHKSPVAPGTPGEGNDQTVCN